MDAAPNAFMPAFMLVVLKDKGGKTPPFHVLRQHAVELPVFRYLFIVASFSST